MAVVRRTFLRTILYTPCSGSPLRGHWWAKRRSKVKVGVSGTRTIVRYRRHCGVRGLIAGDQTGVPSRAHLLLQVRCATLNGDLLAKFQRWFPSVGTRRVMMPWDWL